jgi:hypothetical protein
MDERDGHDQEIQRLTHSLNALDVIANFVYPDHPELWGWYVATLRSEIRKLESMCAQRLGSAAQGKDPDGSRPD